LTPGLLKRNNFHPRENSITYKNDSQFRELIDYILSSNFHCNRIEQGNHIFYRGRIIKFVRANFFISDMIDDYENIKFIYIIRNPFSCVFSRINKGWDVPDYSKILETNEFNKEQNKIILNTNIYFYRMILSWILDKIIWHLKAKIN